MKNGQLSFISFWTLNFKNIGINEQFQNFYFKYVIIF